MNHKFMLGPARIGPVWLGMAKHGVARSMLDVLR